jgi:hypothetical protein
MIIRPKTLFEFSCRWIEALGLSVIQRKYHIGYARAFRVKHWIRKRYGIS